ncbi:uncharacterized protein [Coffea arabica]|uniref:Uncharacterized protein isoform X2 n=1 Tax=Coffea arabica TaxID=13443 RepID=A0A6P6VNB4_COFAR|nr:uncharacterized protein LOC113725186 isoform X2 [Coffea arabica]
MGRNRVHESLEEAHAEKNRRSRDQRAAARRRTKNDAPLGACTPAVTPFNIRDPNAVNQPNMDATESSLGSDSLLASTESTTEQFLAENERDVSRSIGNGANEVLATNLDTGEPSLHRQRRSRKRFVTDPLTRIATEPTVLPSCMGSVKCGW